MTNFIKLKIEKEIKNNAGELRGLEWVEVYVNADNISHFKKVENWLCPNNNVKEIHFAHPKYKDSTYSSRLEKYLLKSETQDAFLKDEFSAFIQEYGRADVSAIFVGDIMFSEAIEVYFKAGVHPLGSPSNKPVISCCGLKELEILVPQKNNKVE
ncbi:hypothetical protein INP85_04490 [Haemophilus parainfluenzae]|uniref:hypothetical protein n=1 Tax=Haemophilus parainfluenzae TaxID=729 RepID=UPI0018740D5A|nr:hypothetical protein [Haemophilus parainfluenzae]MBE4952243.1 hypothetical protein [Haemophilus parainfluenzae]